MGKSLNFPFLIYLLSLPLSASFPAQNTPPQPTVRERRPRASHPGPRISHPDSNLPGLSLAGSLGTGGKKSHS